MELSPTQSASPYRRAVSHATVRPMINSGIWLAGVDGCRAGWIAAFVRPFGEVGALRVFSRFADVLTAPERPAITAVDIPIGLPNVSEERGRAPERIVRAHLGPRRSSVFRVPSRRAVYASIDRAVPDDRERYRRACEVARKTSVDHKAFSKQGFYLCPKIVEVDELLRAHKQLTNQIYETHPEVAFWRINNEHEVSKPKKSAVGLKLRRQFLINAGVPQGLVESDPPKGAKQDDLIDALACAAIARRIHVRLARPFPDPPERDAFGLAMAIWA